MIKIAVFETYDKGSQFKFLRDHYVTVLQARKNRDQMAALVKQGTKSSVALEQAEAALKDVTERWERPVPIFRDPRDRTDKTVNRHAHKPSADGRIAEIASPSDLWKRLPTPKLFIFRHVDRECLVPMVVYDQDAWDDLQAEFEDRVLESVVPWLRYKPEEVRKLCPLCYPFKGQMCVLEWHGRDYRPHGSFETCIHCMIRAKEKADERDRREAEIPEAATDHGLDFLGQEA